MKKCMRIILVLLVINVLIDMPDSDFIEYVILYVLLSSFYFLVFYNNKKLFTTLIWFECNLNKIVALRAWT